MKILLVIAAIIGFLISLIGCEPPRNAAPRYEQNIPYEPGKPTKARYV